MMLKVFKSKEQKETEIYAEDREMPKTKIRGLMFLGLISFFQFYEIWLL